jgi:hypothetical protein
MKFRDALVAGPEHGTDRLPVEIDRRLRRRLGLESGRVSGSTRPVWLRTAIAGFAVAAVVVAVIYYRSAQQSQPAQRVAAGFVDISEAPWSGTVTGNEIDVRDDSPASATVTWVNATIVAAPGTRMATTSAHSLVLTRGAIQIQRTEAMPMFLDVPMGRVVIAAYRSSVIADRQSVTFLLGDGTGHYVDAEGKTHPLVPDVPLGWPPPDGQRQGTGSAADASAPAAVPPSRKRSTGRSTLRSVGADGAVAPAPVSSELPAEQGGPPGATIPPVPRRPDVACTFKSDCEPGWTCRKNESGESVCMGNGGDGAACWFDSDCLSQRCTQRRCVSGPSTH